MDKFTKQRYWHDLSAIFENFEDSPSNLEALDVFRQDCKGFRKVEVGKKENV